MAWTADDIPQQDGRIAIVTGANSGIGFHTALQLAVQGAHVVLACRDMDKAHAAIADIKASHPDAQCTAMHLDLSRLQSVRDFAKEGLEKLPQIDLLINNAGVMIPPRTMTEDDFELQFATNHLGHFALTALLAPKLLSTTNSRVVTVASNAHKWSKINFDDLHRSRFYVPWDAYGQSKLANLLFAYELDRRLREQGHETRSIAAHPGYTSTNIGKHSFFVELATRWVAQDTLRGALTTLRAATDPTAEGGSYWGPKYLFQMAGPPVEVQSNRRSRRLDDAARLWSVSESLCGVQFLSS